MTITLTPEQSRAQDAVAAWLRDRSKPYFVLHGLAGTGKTTLAKHFAAQQSGVTLFGAYSGKAAEVLTRKGCPAQTLHSLIYKPTHERNAELVALRKELAECSDDAKERRLRRQIEALSQPKFVLNEASRLRNAALLIVDEVSMCSAELAADLLHFKVPLLVLGDPGQLPPIEGAGFFNQNPDFVLQEIHRQAAESPIIKLAMAARAGQALKRGDFPGPGGTSLVRYRKEMTADLCKNIEQIVCGSNKARLELNGDMRAARGFGGIFPQKGERLICLRNNPEQGLLNGQILTTSSDTRVSENKLTIFFEETGGQEIDIHRACFEAPHKLKGVDYRLRAKLNEFDFAAAVTAHKAQGSSWREVLVWADMWRWHAAHETFARWAYSAITRAEDRVVVAL